MGQRLQHSSRNFETANQTSFAGRLQFHAFSSVNRKLLPVLSMHPLLPHLVVPVQADLQCLSNPSRAIQQKTAKSTRCPKASECQIDYIYHSHTR